MCWNLMGSISIRHENEFKFIDIEFADKNFRRNLIIPDQYNISLGSMNHVGAVLASKSPSVDQNSFEKEDGLQQAYIVFKHFSPIM